MKRFGVIFCGYQCDNDLDRVLKPWVDLCQSLNIIISAISCQFAEYREMGQKYSNDATEQKLANYLHQGKIRYLNISAEPLKEAAARNLALEPLLMDKCDFIFLLDADEIYTEQEIKNIIEYVNRQDNELYMWFRIRFKNLFGDGKQYVDDFCPPRIFRRETEKFILDRLIYDNDFAYKEKHKVSYEIPIIVPYNAFAYKEIPKNLCNPLHESWLDGERSIQKIAYQYVRWPSCSYKHENGKVFINYKHYDDNRLSYPIIYKIE